MLRTFVTLLALAALPAAGELQLHFLDVGQGDATLVVGPDGTTVLIDGGRPGGGGVITAYLAGLGISGLDYSVATHYHSDHIGGMDEVFAAGFKPTVAAYDRGNASAPFNSQFSSYTASVSGVRQTASVGLALPLGEGATLEFVSVNGQHSGGVVPVGASAQEENSRSVGVVVRYRDFDAYVAGDLTAGGNGTSDVEGPVSAAVGQVEVVRTSHHGSNTSSSATVVAHLDPSFVVHSNGIDADFGHPTETVVKRWCTPSSARVQWCTSEGNFTSSAGSFTSAEGHIRVTTDGRTFEARTELPGAAGEPLWFATWERPGPPPGAGKIAVSELLIDPAASLDSFGEWVELANISNGPLDLSGLRVSAGFDSFLVRSRVLLRQGQRIVLGVDGQPSRNGGVFVPFGAPWEQFNLLNTSNSLTLIAPGGILPFESVAWGGVALPISPGVSSERIDLFSSSSPTNFAQATGAFGDGDQGSPGGESGSDATAWPAQLASFPDPRVGESLNLHLASLDEPSQLFFTGLSLGSSPGTNALGFQIPLNVDGVLLATLKSPEFLSDLGFDGRHEIEIPLQESPGLIGLTLHSSLMTLDIVGLQFVGSKISNPVSFTIQ